ncbi:helix-turn-helix domain-containing protein [Flavobacterium sp.]|uniref:helix-turn-helix domain-containing protein n=1 Tax=Flavobacterium sp. TaxID=239 RepID=UPI0040470972
MENVIEKIKDIRKEKGYSHEYMAHMLDISQVAYSKIEKQETKLSVERLFKIAEILETPLEKILEINPNTIYNQNLKDYSVGHQEVQNLYQENKEQTAKIIELYESRLKDKDILIAQLQKMTQ